MKVPVGLRVGVATHTGRVRRTNEDDYLLVAPGPGQLLAVLADGMGGASGGAEASRIAARTLASALLTRSGSDEERLKGAYGAACRAVFERSQGSPALRDMGTTLTIAWLQTQRILVGHVGDSRALLRRNGETVQLTDDHAVRGAESYLTRCVGGGQESESPDVFAETILPGDRLVLLTDGVWGVLEPDGLEQCLRESDPQRAASALVESAVRAGGPDNATAVVVDRVTDPDVSGPWHTQVLPVGELSVHEAPRREPPSLTRARWPWFAWLAAVVLFALVAAREWLGWDVLRSALDLFRRGA